MKKLNVVWTLTVDLVCCLTLVPIGFIANHIWGWLVIGWMWSEKWINRDRDEEK